MVLLVAALAGVGVGVSQAATVDTTLSLSTSADPSALGKTVRFVAVVASTVRGAGKPAGTVEFATGGSATTGQGPIPGCASVALVNGKAGCSVTYATAGLQLITATYAGGTGFAGSTDSLVQTVSQGTTKTVLSSSDDPSSPREQVTYTAVVKAANGAGTPTGAVAFSTGGSATTGAGGLIPGCASVPLVGGSATCSVTYTATGTQSISASYAGDANFLASDSPSLKQSVDAFATTLQLSSSADPSGLGTRVTYAAVVSGTGSGGSTPTGTVSFSTSGSATTGQGLIPGCASVPLVSGTASCSVTYTTAGSQGITASYLGVGGFTGSSDSLVQSVS